MGSENTNGKYTIVNGMANEFLVCYKENRTEASSAWQGVDPIMKSLPTFLTQLSVIIFLTRLFMLILKPARQPRFVAEIITGIVIGPSALCIIPAFNGTINPFEGVLVTEVMGNLGLTYYMFVVGLEMDITPLRSIGKTALSVAVAGVLFPIMGGVGLYYLLVGNRQHSPPEGAIFWAIALTVTSFPDLARALSDLKLLHTDLGKTALTCAVVNDVSAWVLLVAAVSSINGHNRLYMMLPTMIFIIGFWFVMRPFLSWMIRHTALEKQSSVEGKYSDKHVYFILLAVPLCGYITDLCGSHSMIGAFMLGLIIPSGELGTKIMEKIEDFVVGIMLPPLFLVTGLRTNLHLMFQDGYSPAMMAIVIVLACSLKIISTLTVSLLLGGSLRDGLGLGVLMNTKGVLAIIILNEGRNLKGFDQQTFSAMMLAILIMTGMVGPVVSLTHKSTRNYKRFGRRNLEKTRENTELRVLTCVHNTKNVAGLLNILRISNAQRKSLITVFAVHLIELTGRANSAMLIFHDNNKTTANNNTREKAEAEQIISAFESYESDCNAVSVQPLTAVSPYETMHEDISNFALDKRVTLILLPFHKQLTIDGGLQDDNVQHRGVNQNLLEVAPCSVGILVDRGLSLSSQTDSQKFVKDFRLAVLFIGGRDDREALTYAWRMAGTNGVTLTVVRFLPGKDAEDLMLENLEEDDDDDDSGIFTTMMARERQKELDDNYINEFRFKTMYDKSITFVEKLVNSGDQTLQAISSAYHDFDLYVVGRGHEATSPLTSGLSVWSDYPELGLLGEALVSSNFASQASVLVMQQSSPLAGKSKKQAGSSMGQEGIFGRSNNNLPPQTFVNHRKTDDDYYF